MIRTIIRHPRKSWHDYREDSKNGVRDFVFDYSSLANRLITVSIFEMSFIYLGVFTANETVTKDIRFGLTSYLFDGCVITFYVATVCCIPALLGRAKVTRLQKLIMHRVLFYSAVSILMGNFFLLLFYIAYRG